MTKLILILLLLPSLAHAKLILSGGPEFAGEFESDTNSSNGDPALKSSVLPGLRGEIEYVHSSFPRFSLFGAITYNQGPGRTQYDYTDPDDNSVTQVNDVKSKVSLTRVTTGIRFRMIDEKKMHLFAGVGFQFGVLNVNLDRSNFKGKALVTDDFEQNEHQNLRGVFGELGGEVKLDDDEGIRLAAQISTVSTESFEILGDREVDFNLTTVALSYVWHLN